MPNRSNPAVVAVVAIVESSRLVDTEEKEDLEEEVVEGVALEWIRSVNAVMGSVEGGKAEDETERSSEYAEWVEVMGACESRSVWKEEAKARRVGGSGEIRSESALLILVMLPFDDVG